MSLHLDPKITWAQIVSIVVLIFAAGGAYYQLGELSRSFSSLAASVERTSDRVTQVESRTAVLEMQRVEDGRRLDEIREDVRFIRNSLESLK